MDEAVKKYAYQYVYRKTTSPETFTKQLSELGSSGWKVVSFNYLHGRTDGAWLEREGGEAERL